MFCFQHFHWTLCCAPFSLSTMVSSTKPVATERCPHLILNMNYDNHPPYPNILGQPCIIMVVPFGNNLELVRLSFPEKIILW